jgi:hypothetical protein
MYRKAIQIITGKDAGEGIEANQRLNAGNLERQNQQQDIGKNTDNIGQQPRKIRFQ